MVLSRDIKELFNLFKKSGFKLYIIGGAVRDYLLNRNIQDYDFATNATPNDLVNILDGYIIDSFQASLGSIKIHLNNQIYEITSFRKEYGVKDFRYPERIEYVNNLKEDVLRRDFTVNSLAYSPDEGIIDCLGGLNDLEKRLIKFNKNTIDSINEDPIRIIRALRFCLMLEFNINDEDLDIFKNYAYLVKYLGKIKYDELLKLFSIKGCKEFILKYFYIYKEAYPFLDNQLFFNVLKSDLDIAYLKYVIGFMCFNNFSFDKKDQKIINGLKKIDLSFIDLYQTKLLMIEYQDSLDIIIKIFDSMGIDVKSVSHFVEIIKNEKHCLFVKDLMISYQDLESLNISVKDYSKVFKYLLNGVLKDNSLNKKDILIELIKKGDW